VAQRSAQHSIEDEAIEPAPAWPNELDILPAGRCRFIVAPPRHFLFPAVLLLLAESPSHGYALVDGLNDLGLGRIDRPSVYRALADLEEDGFVVPSDEPPLAGSVRHVYAITPEGQDVLESWMSVVSQERACLELVLKRYWYCNAQRVPELTDGQAPAPSAPHGDEGAAEAAGATGRMRFDLSRRRSSIMVEARSNIGPIAFSTTAIDGWVEAELSDGLVQVEPPPSSHLEVQVSSLSSGNILFDNELLRRVDARRFPTVALDLQAVTRVGEANVYEVVGDVTIHGVARRLSGSISATAVEAEARQNGRPGRRRLLVTGEYVLDIRHFNMEVPRMPLFKIYPDVRLHLRLEAAAVAEPAGA
jgi:DNA-binding PadR family transcriptional regulator/polyisoprenoid-binding protein YceI